MNKHVKIIKCKRILALALALAVGVTFTPMLGGPYTQLRMIPHLPRISR